MGSTYLNRSKWGMSCNCYVTPSTFELFVSFWLQAFEGYMVLSTELKMLAITQGWGSCFFLFCCFWLGKILILQLQFSPSLHIFSFWLWISCLESQCRKIMTKTTRAFLLSNIYIDFNMFEDKLGQNMILMNYRQCLGWAVGGPNVRMLLETFVVDCSSAILATGVVVL